MKLSEKYRPKTWDAVVGQDKAISTIANLRKAGGLSGRYYWFSGASGTGKTTIARLIAREIAIPACIHEMDGQDLTKAKIEEIRDKCGYSTLFGGYVYIINEAHGMRSDIVRHLLTLGDKLPDHMTLIFTTTCDGETELFERSFERPAFLSRCERIDLARRDLTEVFAAYLQGAAEKEGLNGKDVGEYVKLLRRCKNNLRAGFSEVEKGTV